MTTCLFIYYTPSWQPLANIVLPVAAAYCERHGYAKEFVCEDLEGDAAPFLKDSPELSLLPVGFYKMYKLRELLDKYDLIWVLDCDAMITGEQAVTEYIYPHHYLNGSMYFTKDTNGLNAGSWIVRSTEWAKRIIDEVIETFDAPEEQTVLKRVIAAHNAAHAVHFFPHPSINSYLYTEYLHDWQNKVGDVPMPSHEQGQWQPGDLCLHLPGVEYWRRIEIFKQIKEQI